MQQQAQLIRAKCQEVFVKAKQLWPHLNFEHVGIRFDLRGRAAGMACRRGGQFYMRFNADMLTREAFDHVINDTVPHEIAHIVCFMDPRLGRNHDSGWARVCRQLGGTGGRTHSEEVVYGKGYTYEYTTDRGHKVRMGDRHHKHIQAGGTLRYRSNKGNVTQACAYSIVGHQGRTLANPVQRPGKAVPAATPAAIPNTPAAIEAFVRERMALPLVGELRDPHNVLPAPVQRPVVAPVAPVQRPAPGESKAAVSRRIMLAGYRAGQSYETIINAMIAANGYDRQLARATFKANAAKVGIPSTWGG